MTSIDTAYLELIAPYKYEGHRPAEFVTVVVYLEGGIVKVIPSAVPVESSTQTVVWVGVGGEIENIEFYPNEETAAPPPVIGRGQRLETRFPQEGHKGPHKYQFTFHPHGGVPIPVDPIAVVEY